MNNVEDLESFRDVFKRIRSAVSTGLERFDSRTEVARSFREKLGEVKSIVDNLQEHQEFLAESISLFSYSVFSS